MGRSPGDPAFLTVLAEVDVHDPDRAVPSGWWQEDPAEAGYDREIGAGRSDLEEGSATAG